MPKVANLISSYFDVFNQDHLSYTGSKVATYVVVVVIVVVIKDLNFIFVKRNDPFSPFPFPLFQT